MKDFKSVELASGAISGSGMLPLADEAYAELRRKIIARALPPQTLIREADLARQLGMSRTPIREAMRRLQAEGLVSPIPQRGYIVVELNQQDLEDVYEVRAVLEGVSARLAAKRRNRQHLAQIADLVDEMEVAAKRSDDDGLAKLNSQYHAAVARASQNNYLQSMLANIGEIFERYRLAALTLPGRRQQAHSEHRALYEALSLSDEDQAERIAQEHVRHALTARLANKQLSEGGE